MSGMTNQPRVIQADYASFRIVNGRKCLQLIFETDLVNTENVIKMLGVPTPGVSRPVAIALLEPEATPPCKEEAPRYGLGPNDALLSRPEAGSSKRKFSELPLSQQAAIRCSDPDFQVFMACPSENDTTNKVRLAIGLQSRSLLDHPHNTAARELWTALEARYQSYLTDRQYGSVRKP